MRLWGRYGVDFVVYVFWLAGGLSIARFAQFLFYLVSSFQSSGYYLFEIASSVAWALFCIGLAGVIRDKEKKAAAVVAPVSAAIPEEKS
jgi:hypothetical protein